MAVSQDFRMREDRLAQIRQDALQKADRQSAEENESAQHMPVQAPRYSARDSYYGLPVLKQPPWKWEVPFYFFVGGAAGAAAVLASVGKLNDADEAFVRDAQWLAAIGGMVSPALLTKDLGMPLRFLNMMRVFKVQSPMSVGSWTLVAFSNSAAATALLGEYERRTGRTIPVFAETAPVAAVISGLVLATYTGVLIGATAIPAWNENIAVLPIHFAASGLSAAAGILELRGHYIPALNTVGLGAAALETATGAALENHRPAGTEPLRCGRTGWIMRTAGLLSGPLPLFLRLLAQGASSRRNRRLRQVAAVSSIAGSLVTRWAWIQAGRDSARDPRPELLGTSAAGAKELVCSPPATKEALTPTPTAAKPKARAAGAD
jgi:Ni/Fe-hydrogenase subunit HybB-like protein